MQASSSLLGLHIDCFFHYKNDDERLEMSIVCLVLPMLFTMIEELQTTHHKEEEELLTFQRV